MDINKIEEIIYKIILEINQNTQRESEYINNLSHDTNLIEDLGFSSIEIITLIVFIEDKFDICIDDEYLIIDNFQDVGKLISLIDNAINNLEKDECRNQC